MLYYRTPGLVLTLHHLHYPKNNTEDFIQESCLFLPPYIVLHRDFFFVSFSLGTSLLLSGRVRTNYYTANQSLR